MTLISDASPLILLAKISVLSTFTKENKIIIPRKVYIEVVVKGKEKSRYDALLVEKLVEEKKIIIEEVDPELTKKMWKLFGLWAGEAEVIALALKTKNSIITDDKKCINSAKANSINFITSLDVVITLFNKKHIDKKKAMEALEMLEEYGWYKKDIIKHYKEKIK